MRSIPMKQIEGLDYREVLTDILSSAPVGQAGFTVADIQIAVRTIDKLAKANGRVLLEDDEWRQVCERFSQIQWRRAHRSILEFNADVMHAPVVESSAAE